jgi:S1-C subfamily serine protease
MKIQPQVTIKNALAAMLLLVAFNAHALAAQSSRGDFEERRRAVAATLEAATVWIVVEDDSSIASGSGFIVGEGYIVTNAHVVAGFGKDAAVYVLNERMPAQRARIVKKVHDAPEDGQAGGRDFALLRFDSTRGSNLPVLALNMEVKRMDRVSAWGYPAMATQFDVNTERLQEGDTRGLTPPPVVCTEGSVNTIVHTRLGEAILHSAQISGGNSGGPLVNSRGEVVGVNTWGYREDDEGAFLNGAQPASELARFLRENGVQPNFADGQRLTLPLPVEDTGKAEKKVEPRPATATREDRIRDVGSFSARVPLGWSVIEEEKDSLLLGSDDLGAAVGIMVHGGEGKTLRQTAEALSRKFGGTRPEPDDDVYTFTFSDKGVDAVAVIGEADAADRFVTILLFGDTENPGVEEILDSVEDK